MEIAEWKLYVDHDELTALLIGVQWGPHLTIENAARDGNIKKVEKLLKKNPEDLDAAAAGTVTVECKR